MVVRAATTTEVETAPRTFLRFEISSLQEGQQFFPRCRDVSSAEREHDVPPF
jgi:hypothetical protein